MEFIMFFVFLLVLLILYLLEVYVLTNNKPSWVGGILPLLITLIAIFLLIFTKDYSVHSIIMFIIIFLGSFSIWGYGNEKNKRK